MINDNRIKFWTQQHGKRIDRRGTISHPFERNMYVFRDKNVLEIGPGEGRQLKKILPVTKSYAVADISKELLEYELYKNIDRFLITSYDVEFKKQFDVITFWYVMHHVLEEESEDFLRFLRTHLVPGGVLYFNMPNEMKCPEQVANDGIKTTNHSVEKIKEILQELDFDIILEENMGQNCYCLIARETSR